MKLITTYKEHKEKPDEQVQGIGRALAYGGLDYIFNLLKNDEIYSEELEDGIIGIEAYVNEREKELEENLLDILNISIDDNNKISEAIEIYENRNSIEYKKKRFMEDKTIGYFMYEVLKGVDKE